MGRLSMGGRAPAAPSGRASTARSPHSLGGLRAGLGARVNIDSDDDEDEGPRRPAGARREPPAAPRSGEIMQLSDDDDDDDGAGLLRHALRATASPAGRSPGGGWVVVAGGVHSDRAPAPQPPAALAPLPSPASLRAAPDGQQAEDAARAGRASRSPAPTTTVTWHTPLGANGTPPPPLSAQGQLRASSVDCGERILIATPRDISSQPPKAGRGEQGSEDEVPGGAALVARAPEPVEPAATSTAKTKASKAAAPAARGGGAEAPLAAANGRRSEESAGVGGDLNGGDKAQPPAKASSLSDIPLQLSSELPLQLCVAPPVDGGGGSAAKGAITSAQGAGRGGERSGEGGGENGGGRGAAGSGHGKTSGSEPAPHTESLRGRESLAHVAGGGTRETDTAALSVTEVDVVTFFSLRVGGGGILYAAVAD